MQDVMTGNVMENSPCQENEACELGPLSVDIDGQAVNLFFCHQPDLLMQQLVSIQQKCNMYRLQNKVNDRHILISECIIHKNHSSKFNFCMLVCLFVRGSALLRTVMVRGSTPLVLGVLAVPQDLTSYNSTSLKTNPLLIRFICARKALQESLQPL